ncbi:MAG: hypothetical protein Q4G68_05935 [Planctomycetia bacterium]|nr:hypothetical protein [Planctomycetia bacterium]
MENLVNRYKRYIVILFAILMCWTAGKFYAAEGARAKNVVEVEGKGYGATVEEAKQSALTNAVAKVTGELVDAEIRIENETVDEKILIARRADVESYEVITSKQLQDGRWVVTLVAKIKNAAIADRLESDEIESHNIDGGYIASMVELADEQETQNFQFLTKYFKENQFPYSLIKVAPFEGTTVRRASENGLRAVESDTKEVIFTVQVRPDMEKYNTFSQGLIELLSKIAVKKFPVTMNLTPVDPKDKMQKFLPNVMISSSNRRPRPNVGNIIVFVFRSQTGKLKTSRWMAFELPAIFREFFSTHSAIIPVVNVSIYKKSGDKMMSRVVPLRLYLGDNLHNRTIFSYNMFPFCERFARGSDGDDSYGCSTIDGRYSYKGSRYSYDNEEECFYIAPLTTGGYSSNSLVSPQMNIPVHFKVTLEEIKQIGRAEVKIIAKNPMMDAFYKKYEVSLKSSK